MTPQKLLLCRVPFCAAFRAFQALHFRTDAGSIFSLRFELVFPLRFSTLAGLDRCEGTDSVTGKKNPGALRVGFRS
jgi:hypothetical protein